MSLYEHMSQGVIGSADPLKQLRANRTHALNAWLSGAPNRWEGDDGRVLNLAEYAFWPADIQQAEQAKFAELDAVYEQIKSTLGDGQ